MKLFFQFLRLEFKKIFLQFPKILLEGMLLLVILSSCLFISGLTDKKNHQKKPIFIGVLAKKNEPMIDWMIQTANQMPDMTYSFHAERLDEKNSLKKFFRDENNVLFIVPPKYISSIIRGENKHLTIRFSKSQMTVVNVLIKELAKAASCFILDTEAAIYSMQDYYDKYHLSNKKKDELALNIKYLKEITSFSQAIEKKPVDSGQSDTLIRNLLLSVFVLLPPFLGLVFAPSLTSESTTLKKQLSLNGLGTWKQILTKALALFTAFLSFLLFLGLLLFSLSFSKYLPLPELFFHEHTGYFLLILADIPVLLVSAFFCLFIFELTADALSSVLLLFFSTLLTGLFSGFFYPEAYLPHYQGLYSPVIKSPQTLQ